MAYLTISGVFIHYWCTLQNLHANGIFSRRLCYHSNGNVTNSKGPSDHSGGGVGSVARYSILRKYYKKRDTTKLNILFLLTFGLINDSDGANEPMKCMFVKGIEEMRWGIFFLLTITTSYGKSAVLRKNTTGDVQIPESLLMELGHIENVSEFMSRFITPRRPPAFGVFLAYLEDGRSKTVVSQTKETVDSNDSTLPIAKNAGCIPEQRVIELPRPSDPAVIVWPGCTRIKRCGGCCPSKRLTCLPTITSIVNVRTIAARYSKPASKTFDLLGYETVRLVQHEKCRCLCRETKEDCTSLQIYSPDDCLCVCKNAASSEECTGPDRHWDAMECSCKCNKYHDCSTGFFFNPQVCKCESIRDPLRGISSSGIMSIRPAYKDDGGENDNYRSRHVGIRPLEDDVGPFSTSLRKADRKWHKIATNGTD